MQELFTYKRIYDRQGFVLDRLWRKKNQRNDNSSLYSTASGLTCLLETFFFRLFFSSFLFCFLGPPAAWIWSDPTICLSSLSPPVPWLIQRDHCAVMDDPNWSAAAPFLKAASCCGLLVRPILPRPSWTGLACTGVTSLHHTEDLRGPPLHVVCTSVFHAVSPRAGLVELLTLSNFHAVFHRIFRLIMIMADTSVIGASLSSFPWFGCAFSSEVSQTDSNPMTALRRTLLLSCAPSMTWLRNDRLVSDFLDRGG